MGRSWVWSVSSTGSIPLEFSNDLTPYRLVVLYQPSCTPYIDLRVELFMSCSKRLLSLSKTGAEDSACLCKLSMQWASTTMPYLCFFSREHCAPRAMSWVVNFIHGAIAMLTLLVNSKRPLRRGTLTQWPRWQAIDCINVDRQNVESNRVESVVLKAPTPYRRGVGPKG